MIRLVEVITLEEVLRDKELEQARQCVVLLNEDKLHWYRDFLN